MSKTGFHVQIENRDPNYDDRMMNLKPAGMTVVAAQASLWWILTFHQRSPNTRFIMRMAEGEDGRKAEVGHADPKTAAQSFAKFCDKYIPKNGPYAELRSVVYFQPYDELGGGAADPQTKAMLEWLNLYTKFAVDEFAARGLSFSGINLAEGNPPQTPYDSYDGWPLMLDALKAINRVGPRVAIVGLHTYGFNTGLFDSTDTHLLRFEYLERYLDAQGLKNAYIGLHETGKDSPSFFQSYDYYAPRGYAKRPDGMTGYTAYANDMVAFDTIISAKWRVLWGNWYTLDMLDDGYEVKDHVTLKGNRVVEVYPLFSIVETYIEGHAPQYVLNGVSGGPIELPTDPPPTTPPPATGPILKAGWNLRWLPMISDATKIATTTKEQPVEVVGESGDFRKIVIYVSKDAFK